MFMRRILNEKKQIELNVQSNSSMFTLNHEESDIYNWTATVFGQPDTLYENYQFQISIKLHDLYPQSPPTVKFVTRIEHLNINNCGDICMDILKDKWKSFITLTSILKSIVELLGYPNQDDTFNNTLFELYRTDKNKYESLIKECCRQNALLQIK